MAAKNRPEYICFQQDDIAVLNGRLCSISKIHCTTNTPNVTVRMQDTKFARLSIPTDEDLLAGATAMKTTTIANANNRKKRNYRVSFSGSESISQSHDPQYLDCNQTVQIDRFKVEFYNRSGTHNQLQQQTKALNQSKYGIKSIQTLHELLKEKDTQIESLKATVSTLTQQYETLIQIRQTLEKNTKTVTQQHKQIIRTLQEQLQSAHLCINRQLKTENTRHSELMRRYTDMQKELTQKIHDMNAKHNQYQNNELKRTLQQMERKNGQYKQQIQRLQQQLESQTIKQNETQRKYNELYGKHWELICECNEMIDVSRKLQIVHIINKPTSITQMFIDEFEGLITFD
eukprot:232838_1